jgi:hypothetical protein
MDADDGLTLSLKNPCCPVESEQQLTNFVALEALVALIVRVRFVSCQVRLPWHAANAAVRQLTPLQGACVHGCNPSHPSEI